MLSGEHVADGKLCPMAVTDSSQRSEGQGGLASGCVTVLGGDTDRNGGGGAQRGKKLLFLRQEIECLSHRIGHSFVQ